VVGTLFKKRGESMRSIDRNSIVAHMEMFGLEPEGSPTSGGCKFDFVTMEETRRLAYAGDQRAIRNAGRKEG
jgi:hypothetical protein